MQVYESAGWCASARAERRAGRDSSNAFGACIDELQLRKWGEMGRNGHTASCIKLKKLTTELSGPEDYLHPLTKGYFSAYSIASASICTYISAGSWRAAWMK